MATFGGESVNECPEIVVGGVGRKNEGEVCEDVSPFEWRGCSMYSDGFPERGGIGMDDGCPNADEC